MGAGAGFRRACCVRSQTVAVRIGGPGVSSLLEGEEEGGEVVALVEGAGLGVEGGGHFLEGGAGV